MTGPLRKRGANAACNPALRCVTRRLRPFRLPAEKRRRRAAESRAWIWPFVDRPEDKGVRRRIKRKSPGVAQLVDEFGILG